MLRIFLIPIQEILRDQDGTMVSVFRFGVECARVLCAPLFFIPLIVILIQLPKCTKALFTFNSLIQHCLLDLLKLSNLHIEVYTKQISCDISTHLLCV